MRARSHFVIPCLAAALGAAPGPESGLRAQRTAQTIRLDGRLDEVVWSQAAPASGFTQEWPLRGQATRQRTEVRVLYDDHYLYIGARMHHDPTLDGGRATVVKRLHRRDQDSQSDWFGAAIDSNHDRRTALVFEVNAAGVQKDQVIYNDVSFDASWDGVWESAVSADEGGWTAELKIPLALLRFKPGEGPQTWGINFSRSDQGTIREFSRWMVVPRGESSFVSRFPTLEGLEGLRPQPRQEWVPFLSSARKFETTRPFDDRKWDQRAGLDARWGLNSHSQVDLSVRPDFGQVEVDQAVLNLGTLETFFPEKRPFFLEGMDAFRVAGPDLFYSRRIGQGLSDPTLNAGESLQDRPAATDITAAAKYTAKFPNGTQVGLLGASVEPARALIQDPSGRRLRRELVPLTNFGVLRVQQLLDGRGSYLGGFASGMHQAGPEGRVAQVQALDGLYKTSDRSGLLEGTLSRSQAGPKEAQEQGWRGRLRARRDWSNGWGAEVQAINAGRTYDPNDVGYLSRADEQRLYAVAFRRWDQPWGILRSREFGLEHVVARDQAGHTFLRNFNTWAKTDLTNFVSLWGGGGVDLAIEDDRELRTYADPAKKYLPRASLPYLNLGGDTPGNRPWYVRVNASRSWHEGGPSTDTTLFQSIKPTFATEIQLSTSLTRHEGELKWLETPVATPIVGLRRLSQFDQTLRLAYAFNPRLTIQLFSQWLAANWNFRDLKHHAGGPTLRPGLPPDQPSGTVPQTSFSYRTWNLNLITRWEFRPGSTFFLVYTHGSSTDALINNRASLSPRPDLALLRTLPSDDVIQAKFSWLFR
ncbi:MAG: carbohydrate binding family 9 domain-containing protein [Holophagaceae bacterium]|uniref:Carbohydrate binding family 9 domain-containing protein n=1 Tax=Candidatus Geothrix skivensis TaxID=2954439 RepID=A0A9D7SJ16_9BACT|nr:carbohydrate binding family 9 domain-containing protein [Candidatus Geothrix skivensis]